ncbi:hypothetical protein DICPUDRAFT_86938 [Dictyostelium purpureum]|uniref:Lipoxygenase domain-containing protein n=1 Tax=Dictyostelium purpureum TaxID=5786 RepID=F0ZEW8_DICPU|nr:uncharacterized protein DICPUDRAFT_86938 [Dictyostelium purpureum]EGC37501.1 hypothetical protein DICPUDRAFT_86938 [Dictyostelium purpureum]|eukprot:XP_003285975.1 hypothetical protein DICPUDRAFT_86938 [Dictyostelium purpureum]
MEFINKKINEKSRDILQGLISHADKQARKSTRNELIEINKGHYKKYLNLVPMIATVKVIRTCFKEPLNFHMVIECENSNTTPQKTQSRYKSFDSNWSEDKPFEFLMEKIEKKGFNINFMIIQENKYLFNNTKSILSVHIDQGFIGSSLEVRKKVYFESIREGLEDDIIIGNIEFEITMAPIKDFGLRYWERLPVFDPNFTVPPYAMPSDSFVHHDEFNELIVGFVIVYWLLRGEKNSFEMLPPNIQSRCDFSNTDEFFTSRRLNGCNRPYNNFEMVQDKEWQYELNLCFTGWEIKKDVWFPDNTSCRFKLINDELEIHSIAYQMHKDGETIVQMADGSQEWNDLKIKYMMIEFNYNINWGHVGVHYIVEMFNMAFYRNIVHNPIKNLLYPHFDGVIFNNWLVVRPMIDGVVTLAAAFTYEGQVQMLRDKFKEVTYKWEPTSLPENIKNNVYDPANQAIWNGIKEYVEDFFLHNQNEILKYWGEIEKVSDDLKEHSLNPDNNQVEIKTIQDLQQCSVYIIYQAVFQHAWIHWKAWDEEAEAVIFNKGGETSLKNIKYYQNLGNAIEAGVQYPSPYVRQYPILDSEFGGPELLQKKIWENAHKINPGISIGSLVMSPNI